MPLWPWFIDSKMDREIDHWATLCKQIAHRVSRPTYTDNNDCPKRPESGKDVKWDGLSDDEHKSRQKMRDLCGRRTRATKGAENQLADWILCIFGYSLTLLIKIHDWLTASPESSKLVRASRRGKKASVFHSKHIRIGTSLKAKFSLELPAV